jgi:hypothetical protein
VARLDTTAPVFNAQASWGTFDASPVTATKVFHGAAFDGQYVYFVPEATGDVLRYDTRADFATASSWTVFNPALVDSGAQGFRGAIFDGQNLYFVPYPATSHLTRYDTQMTFGNAASWTAFDITTLMGAYVNAKGFFGSAFDGRYLYLVPYTNTVAVRFDAKAPSWLPRRWNASF